MGNNSTSSAIPEGDLEFLHNHTTLTNGEIQYLHKRFRNLTGGRRIYLIKRDLYMMNDIQSNPINAMIISALFERAQKLKFVEFAKFIHKFKAQSEEGNEERRKEKFQLLFNMFDVNKDGCITKDELFDIVHRMYSDQIEYQDILRVVDIMFAEIDSTNTGRIFFDDFCASIENLDVDMKLMLKISEI